MGLIFLVVGLILLLASAYHLIGIILLVIGAILMFGYPVGPGPYFGRRW